MKTLPLIAVLFFAISAHGQMKSNAAVQQQLKSLGSEKIGVHFDEASKVTTIKAVSENFPDADAKRAGVKAINFAVGVIYVGPGLDRSPEQYLLSFWVMSGKPRFGEDHSFAAMLGGEMLDLGKARYAYRERDGMEYLNFNLTREQLRRLAAHPQTRFRLGRSDFSFTGSQTKLLSDLFSATEVR